MLSTFLADLLILWNSLYPDQTYLDPESVMQLPHLTGHYDKADIEFSSGG
jgi:hypothetical protein